MRKCAEMRDVHHQPLPNWCAEPHGQGSATYSLRASGTEARDSSPCELPGAWGRCSKWFCRWGLQCCTV